MAALRRTFIFLLPLLLVACAAPQRVNLKTEDRNKIAAFSAHVIVIQDEVLAEIQAPNVGLALGGGLIGAMIDSSIANRRVKDAQQIFGALYPAIDDLDFRKALDEALREGSHIAPLKLSTVTTTPRDLSWEEVGKLAQRLPAGQALLLIVPRYTITPDFRNLDVISHISIWAGPGAYSNTGSATPIQRSVLRYQSAPVGPGGAASLDLWRADSAALFRSSFHESIAETLRMIAIDLHMDGDGTIPTAASEPVQMSMAGDAVKIEGRLLRSGAQRAIWLGDNQWLYSLPRDARSAASPSRP